MRSKAQLEREITEKGLTIPTTGTGPRNKVIVADLVKVLQDYFIEKKFGTCPSYLAKRLKYEPSLAYRYEKIKDAEKESMWTDDNWIAEVKFDGCRCIGVYEPDTAFHFYSRNLSVQDYLPCDLTDNIVLKNKFGVPIDPKSLIGVFNSSFTFDSEILADGNVDSSIFKGKSGTATNNYLNAITSILQSEQELSHQLQTQASVYFQVFDVMEVGGVEVHQKPWYQRRKVLRNLFSICKLEETLPFELSKVMLNDKRKLLDDVLAKGGEGIILKNINKPYDINGRHKDVMLKVKRGMSSIEGCLNDVDVFIDGYEAGEKGKGFENLVGSVKLSTNIRKEDGTLYKHWIGKVSGIPMELREKMTEIVEGAPRLKEEYYGKVITISGQEISCKSLRFKHCYNIDTSWTFRTDKSPMECVMEESELLGNVFSERK